MTTGVTKQRTTFAADFKKDQKSLKIFGNESIEKLFDSISGPRLDLLTATGKIFKKEATRLPFFILKEAANLQFRKLLTLG